ncbi:MAG TPA: hypothetical protein VGI58_10015 [Streptosporangiaceae bacterium]|jgi:hypothetical protein
MFLQTGPATATLGGWDLAYPVIAGSGAALVVVAWSWLVGGRPGPGRHVHAGAAWTPSDSWVTNTAAITGLLAVTWAAVGSPVAPLITSTANTSVGVLFLIFAGAAALAPIIYASLGVACDEDAPVTGRVSGFLLAGAATVFAVGGEVAAFALYVDKTAPSVPARVTLWVALGVGALFVAVYAIRTMTNALTNHLDQAGPAQAQPRSKPMLMPQLGGSSRSATL